MAPPSDSSTEGTPDFFGFKVYGMGFTGGSPYWEYSPAPGGSLAALEELSKLNLGPTKGADPEVVRRNASRNPAACASKYLDSISESRENREMRASILNLKCWDRMQLLAWLREQRNLEREYAVAVSNQMSFTPGLVLKHLDRFKNPEQILSELHVHILDHSLQIVIAQHFEVYDRYGWDHEQAALEIVNSRHAEAFLEFRHKFHKLRFPDDDIVNWLLDRPGREFLALTSRYLTHTVQPNQATKLCELCDLETVLFGMRHNRFPDRSIGPETYRKLRAAGYADDVLRHERLFHSMESRERKQAAEESQLRESRLEMFSLLENKYGPNWITRIEGDCMPEALGYLASMLQNWYGDDWFYLLAHRQLDPVQVAYPEILYAVLGDNWTARFRSQLGQ